MRRPRANRAVLSAIVVLLAVLPLSALAVAPNDDTTLVVRAESIGGTGPVTNGDSIAYTASYGTHDQADVLGANLMQRVEYPVASEAGYQWAQGIFGYDVVWWEQSDTYVNELRGKNLATGQVFDVTRAAEWGESPAAVSDPWVLTWLYTPDQYVLRARNWRTHGAPFDVARFDQGSQRLLVLDGEQILMLTGTGSVQVDVSHIEEHWQLLTMSISHPVPRVILEGLARYRFVDSGDTRALYPESGSHLAWQTPTLRNGVGVAMLDIFPDRQQLLAIELASGRLTTIASRPPAVSPDDYVKFSGASTDGRYVYWISSGYHAGYTDSSVWGYDLETGSTFRAVSDGVTEGGYPTGFVGGVNATHDLLLWETPPRVPQLDGMSRVEIHATRTAQLLPTGPVANPLTSDPVSVWFAATAHTLAAGFKTYWDANGGLAVFGYPLTEEFFERDAQAAGAERTVQYFERQRFEWRPENAGTPYEVLLARLGAEDAAQRGLLTTMPFQPVAPDAAPADCQYAAATQHAVCGAFLHYWQAHGLEFGDDGVSFRESLAQFGYPLSEPFTDPATGLTIQYFERAVFEYHPEHAGTTYVVLLRRLGAEALAARGW